MHLIKNIVCRWCVIWYLWVCCIGRYEVVVSVIASFCLLQYVNCHFLNSLQVLYYAQQSHYYGYNAILKVV